MITDSDTEFPSVQLVVNKEKVKVIVEFLDMTYEQLNKIDAIATDIRFYLARKQKNLEREGASESDIAECAEDCSSAAGIEATIQCGNQLCDEEYQEYLRLLQKYKDDLGS